MASISTVSSKHPHQPVERKLNRIKPQERLSTNPPHSSSQQGISTSRKASDDEKPYACGNVGKLLSELEIEDLQELPCGKRSGKAWKTGKACREQVFSNEESAQNTARSFKEHFGGEYFVARCSKCGLIHLEET